MAKLRSLPEKAEKVSEELEYLKDQKDGKENMLLSGLQEDLLEDAEEYYWDIQEEAE